MILDEAYDQIGRRTGLDPDITEDQTKMIDGMEKALKQIYRRCKLIALKTKRTLTTVADQYFYTLDSNYLYGLNFSEYDSSLTTDAGILLDIRKKQWFDRNYPNPDTNDTSQPTMIIPHYKIWVTNQPTAASKLAIASGSTSDTSVVRVRGLVSDVETVESVTLTGTTSVNTSNTFDANGLISITKLVTTGTITATSNAAVVTNISLLASEREKVHWYVRLHKVPDKAYTAPYTFYRKPWAFSNESDLIPFDETFNDVFVTLATAVLQKMDNKAQWKDNWNIAMAQIEEVKDNNYFADDSDARMGLIEIDDYDGEYEWWH